MFDCSIGAHVEEVGERTRRDADGANELGQEAAGRADIGDEIAVAGDRRVAVGAPDVAAMHEAGRIPTGAQAINYWFLLAKHGEQTGNSDLLATALAKFREGVGSNPRAQRQIEEFEKALEKLLDKQDADKGGKPDKQ